MAGAATANDSNFVIPDPGNPVNRFYEVDAGVYRGARPDGAALTYLASTLKVRTVLDLENDNGAISAERPMAEVQGMRFVSIPLSGFLPPSDADIHAALSLLGDRANYPVFVHCHYGEDRTGLVIGLYRVFNDHWTPADAYREMKNDGFHSMLVPLYLYFKHATGYDD